MPRRVSLPNADDLFRGNGHHHGGTTRELDPPSERTNPNAEVIEQPRSETDAEIARWLTRDEIERAMDLEHHLAGIEETYRALGLEGALE